MIRAVLTVEVDYPEGEEDDLVDVESTLRSAASYLANQGFLTQGLDMPVGRYDAEVDVNFSLPVQERLPFDVLSKE